MRINHDNPLRKSLFGLSKALACIGGFVLIALVLMSVVSIIGRKIASLPIPGDIEILQTAAAFAIAYFFPYCHMMGADVKVDFFTHNLPHRWVAFLDLLSALLVGLFAFLIAWRTGAGALSTYLANEETMILTMPLWWGQALMVPGFVLLGFCAFYNAWEKAATINTPPHGTFQPSPKIGAPQ